MKRVRIKTKGGEVIVEAQDDDGFYRREFILNSDKDTWCIQPRPARLYDYEVHVTELPPGDKVLSREDVIEALDKWYGIPFSSIEKCSRTGLLRALGFEVEDGE